MFWGSKFGPVLKHAIRQNKNYGHLFMAAPAQHKLARIKIHFFATIVDFSPAYDARYCLFFARCCLFSASFFTQRAFFTPNVRIRDFKTVWKRKTSLNRPRDTAIWPLDLCWRSFDHVFSDNLYLETVSAAQCCLVVATPKDNICTLQALCDSKAHFNDSILAVQLKPKTH